MSATENLYELSEDAAGRFASELKNNPLLERIFFELDAQCVDTWRNGSNPAQREAAWYEMVAIQGLRHKLQGRIDAVAIELASRRKRNLAS